MKTLHISVVDKIATYQKRDGDIVCGNSDYQIAFTFDSMWDGYTDKTARFIWNDRYYDVPIKEGACEVPIIKDTEVVTVGVYSGDMFTTTGATINCHRSIRCGSTPPSTENNRDYANEAKEAADRAEAALAEALNKIPQDGVSPTINAVPLPNGVNGTEIIITDVNGTKKFTVMDGKDGVDGKDYVLTETDKAEIAEMVDGATLVQAPKYVDSVEEMTDTNRVYVMASTGKIWAYMKALHEETVTDTIESTTDNPAYDNKCTNKGALSDRTGTFVTPFIDLSKYSGQITMTVKGATCLSESASSASALDAFGEKDENGNPTYLYRYYMSLAGTSANYIVPNICDSLDKVTGTHATTTTTFVIDLPRNFAGTPIKYIRFTCGLMSSGSTWAKSTITIDHKVMVEGGAWIDTGTSYSPSLSDKDLNTVAEQAASIVDNNLLSVIGSGEVSV